jgi:hypothetical protein
MIKERRPEPHVVIVGNLCSGFIFYGPFPDFDSASEWGERTTDGNCDYVPLDKPD